MANKTALDDEGVFYLRPLFYGDEETMKFGLSPSNFKIRYETFCNDEHPSCQGKNKHERKHLE